MPKPVFRTRRGLLLAAGLSLFVPQLPGRAADSDVAVVVNPKVPVDNLKLADLKKVMMGEQQYWPGNLRVVLLIRAPVARERDVVLRKLYGMNESQFKQYWITKVFRQEAQAGPKIVYSNDDSASLANAIPGAIAFVLATAVPPGLKVLKIDGHRPGEAGYPLQ